MGKANPVYFLLLAAVAIILALPMLLYGPMPGGHDTWEHMNYARNFTQQFWSGDLYPRWLIGLNHGLGSPTFFVFPPLPYYVCALLEPVTKLFHGNPMSLTALLALWGSGVCAFVWLRAKFGQNVALACAILYMLMPYLLSVDFYRRFALPECWAAVWMPLILYFTVGVIEEKRRAMVGLAIAYGLLIVSHAISAVMFSFVPLAAAVTLSAKDRRARSGVRVAASLLLGIGLSAVYLFAAFFHERYVAPTGKTEAAWPWIDYMVTFGKQFSANPYIAHFTRTLSWIVLDMLLLTAICAYAVLRKASPNSRKELFFWLSICACSLFMMSSPSSFLWRTFPVISHLIQEPFRFNAVFCVAALPILAFFLSGMSLKSLSPQPVVLAIACALVGFWLIGWAAVWKGYQVPIVDTTRETQVNEHDGWFRVWSVPGLDQKSALQASAGPRVSFSGTPGSVDVLVWKPRDIEFRTESGTGGAVMVNQFYYPAWQAEVDGQPGSAEIEAAMPAGLLELRVPPGIHKVRLEIPVSTVERLGGWVSALCALFCLAVLIVRRDRARQVAA